MDNHITLRQATRCLDVLHISWKLLPIGDGYKILITTQGGRVFGPFRGEDDESLFWMNGAFSDPKDLEAYLSSGRFHIGGERLWMGPELSFFCKAPELFDSTYTVQPELDPGAYMLSSTAEDSVRLFMNAELDILPSDEKKKKSFSLSRTFSPAANPLNYMSSLQDCAVRYCGFTQEIAVEDLSPEVKTYLEPWLLTQVNPGGRILVPYLGKFDFVDYYDPVDESIQIDHGGFVELLPDGKRKFKTAYRAANTFGRFAYVGKRGNEYYLIVRNYYNDPSEPYCSEPWHQLGDRGCSMYFYNDDTSNGGFTELEHTCGMLGLDARRRSYCGRTSLWMFFGDKHALERIIQALLGISYSITF